MFACVPVQTPCPDNDLNELMHKLLRTRFDAVNISERGRDFGPQHIMLTPISQVLWEGIEVSENDIRPKLSIMYNFAFLVTWGAVVEAWDL